MCVASSGKVIKINNNIAEVDFGGNIITAHAGIIPVKVGDRVLVHAGLIIQVLKNDDAKEIERLFKEIDEITK